MSFTAHVRTGMPMSLEQGLWEANYALTGLFITEVGDRALRLWECKVRVCVGVSLFPYMVCNGTDMLQKHGSLTHPLCLCLCLGAVGAWVLCFCFGSCCWSCQKKLRPRQRQGQRQGDKEPSPPPPAPSHSCLSAYPLPQPSGMTVCTCCSQLIREMCAQTGNPWVIPLNPCSLCSPPCPSTATCITPPLSPTLMAPRS